ncbi:hypothetical protein D4R78_02890 [bacterium]|nr:MAG: hypothetical protein D4R78_02890 [bacterium]
MCPQDRSQKQHDIVRAVQKLDQEITSLNQQKQQLLRELKTAPIKPNKLRVFMGFLLGKSE